MINELLETSEFVVDLGVEAHESGHIKRALTILVMLPTFPEGARFA